MVPLGVLYKFRWSIFIPFKRWIPHPKSDLDDYELQTFGFLEVGIPNKIGVRISFPVHSIYIFFINMETSIL